MKRIGITLAVLAVTLIATSTFAGFNIPGAPSSVNQAVSQGTELGLEQAAKDKIRKFNCSFTGATGTQTTCMNGKKTFPDLVRELGGIVSGGKVVGKKVALKATVQGAKYETRRDRRNYVRGELQKIQQWYRISVYDRSGDGKAINMSANAY